MAGDDNFENRVEEIASNLVGQIGPRDDDAFLCAQCRNRLAVPPHAHPDHDDVRVCQECFDPATTDFIDTHYSDAVHIGVYPVAEGGAPR